MFREYWESFETNHLSDYAVKACQSKGRKKPEEPCVVRTVFQRDRDRIIHSKAFRRLKHKTQVFLAPERDHYRTRLTHTLEVAQISRTMARALKLNEDLTEAIALGHDLGHTPFGHNGEDVLDRLLSKGFRHYEQSLKVVDVLEKHNDREGLNLTYEVRDGILNHTGQNMPHTLEGQLVKMADRIAYLNHDIDDAKRAGIVSITNIPEELLHILGDSHGMRINTMILDIIKQSYGKRKIVMSSEIKQATDALRTFMFENIYYNDIAKSEDRKAAKIMTDLFNYYMENTAAIALEEDIEKYGREELVKDYIAGMTDRYAIKKFNDLFVPLPWDK